MPNIIIPKEFDSREKGKATAEAIRKHEDIQSGLRKAEGGQRGDYAFCREMDKVLKDIQRFKNPNDRKKIDAEYYGREKDYRESQHRKMGLR